MLNLDQIKGDLICSKLGKSSVVIEDAGWDESIGPVIKDGRFAFIQEWLNGNDKFISEFLFLNDDWMDVQEIFHKYIRKAYAKQGIKQGDNIIRVGKKSITVKLEHSMDESWHTDEFGKEHRIDAGYFITDEEYLFSSFGMSTIMNSVIDNDQLLIDYLLYTDNLIAELKSALRRTVIGIRDEYNEITCNSMQLNELGLQYLLDGCNALLDDYKTV